MRAFLKRHSGFCLSILLILAVGLTPAITSATPRAAQNTCPVIVKQAIDTTGSYCAKAGRNKLCYGNSTIHADFQAGAGNPTFQGPGDLVDVSQVKQFTLGAMDSSTNTWGVALMKIQADLPDSDPNQNVTFIMFGNVQMSDAAPDANATLAALTPTTLPTATATPSATVDPRQATRAAATATKFAAVLRTALAKASTPTPTGTISAVRAAQAAATATRLANLIGTATALIPPTATTAPTSAAATGNAGNSGYKALQAFYFQTGTRPGCDQAPYDGVLIQSPQGSGPLRLSIDGALITLASTVFLQAQPGQFLTISTLEGGAQVIAPITQNGLYSNGVSKFVGPGSSVQVPIDGNLRAAGAPQQTQFFIPDTVRALPARLLPNPITIPPGLPAGTLFGQWNGSANAPGNYNFKLCGAPTILGSLFPDLGPVLIALDSTGNFMWLTPSPDASTEPYTLMLSKGTDGLYTGTYLTRLVTSPGNRPLSELLVSEQLSLKLTTATHIDGQDTLGITPNQPGCTATAQVTIDQSPSPAVTLPAPGTP